MAKSGQLIFLKEEDNRKVFDGFLFAAAGGGSGGLQIVFTPNKRLAILQYLLLNEIKKNCHDHKGEATSRTHFFASKQEHLVSEALKLLIMNPSELDESLCRSLNDVWQRVTAIDNLSRITSSANLDLLITAVQQLTAVIYPQEVTAFDLGKRALAN